jgi:aspartate racemase
MKTIGLLGGMSWESTAGYYRMINEGVKQRLGGLHSAEIVLYSVDFDPIERLQREGDWEGAAAILSEAALRLESAGAAFLLICTNTMHLVSASIEKSVRIPLLHIADATADVLVAKGVKKVGLLGTAFTMEHDFYKGRLQRVYGVAKYLSIIEALAADGAEGVILGCTEIGMLVSQEDTKVPLFDTTVIHSQKAVEQALLP